jgi:PBP1b-binding outer membrane lipoprotein LpoB
MKRLVLLIIIAALLLASCNNTQPPADTDYPPADTADPPATEQQLPSPSSTTDLELAKQRSVERLSSRNTVSAEPPLLSIEDTNIRLQDNDNNGLTEWLVLDVDYYAYRAEEEVNVFANIYAANGDFIGSGNLTTEERAQKLTHLCLDYGDSSFSVYFNGLYIRQSELDGPYTVEMNIYRKYGDSPYITEWHETDSITHNSFQGALLKITSVSDTIVNNGENIRFTINVDAEVAGNYTIYGSLFKDEGETFTWLEGLDKELYLPAGTNQVQLDFDAKAIKGKGISGPYSLSLRAEDHLYASGYDYVSANYQLSQLASPALYLRNPIYSSNSRANEITVVVPLNVTVAGTYFVYGSMWKYGSMMDGDVNLISVNNLQPVLSVGTHDIQLTFDTSAIAEYGLTGPFTVAVGILDQNRKSMVLENYQLELNRDI